MSTLDDYSLCTLSHKLKIYFYVSHHIPNLIKLTFARYSISFNLYFHAFISGILYL